MNLSASRTARVATVLLATSLLVACSATDGGTANDAATPGESGELVKVSVGTIPAILSAPLFLGIQEGIFESHGLDLEVNFADGGAAVIPSVMSGENQFGYSNTVSQLAAVSGGLPLRLVHSSWAPCCEVDEDDHGVLVLPDSGIDGPEGLEGVNIAVNTLHNIGEVHIRRALDGLGVDHSAVTWTQLPFSDMGEALERGDVDAIWVSEPFLTPGLEAGWKRILAPGVQSFPDQVSGYYSTSEQFATQNPEVVQAFKDAMTEVNEFANANTDLVRQVAIDEMGFDADTTLRVNVPRFPNADGLEALENYGKAAVEYEILDKEPADYEALFALRD